MPSKDEWLLVVIAMAAITLVSLTCSRNQPTPPAAQSSNAAALGPSHPDRDRIDLILSEWDNDPARNHLLIDRIVGLAADGPDDSLLAFPISESQFVQLPPEQQQQALEDAIETGKQLRSVVRAILDRATRSRDAGDLDAASRDLRAVRRIGEVNSRDDVVLIGQAVGRAIVKKADTIMPSL